MFLSQYIFLDHFDLNFLQIFRWLDNVLYKLIKHNFTILASLNLIFIQNVFTLFSGFGMLYIKSSYFGQNSDEDVFLWLRMIMILKVS